MLEDINAHNQKRPQSKRWGLALLCLIVAAQTLAVYAETPPCAPLLREGIVQHTVGTGETLASLSTTYDLSELTLRTTNALGAEVLSNIPLLRGTQLLIPPAEGSVVTVKPKENLLSLALANGVKASTLAWANGVTTSMLTPGQRVFIPATDCIPGPESLIWPTSGRVTSGYGRRNISVRGNTFHKGIDIGVASNTPVVAARAGRVTQAGWVGAYGYAVYLDHLGGSQTRYAHLSRIAVPEGSVVRQGDVIGWVGSSGASTGPHLHFELRQDGRTVNPLSHLP